MHDSKWFDTASDGCVAGIRRIVLFYWWCVYWGRWVVLKQIVRLCREKGATNKRKWNENEMNVIDFSRATTGFSKGSTGWFDSCFKTFICWNLILNFQNCTSRLLQFQIGWLRVKKQSEMFMLKRCFVLFCCSCFIFCICVWVLNLYSLVCLLHVALSVLVLYFYNLVVVEFINYFIFCVFNVTTKIVALFTHPQQHP